MSEVVDEFGVDPWAWLRDVPEDQAVDLSAFRVVAVMVAAEGDPERCSAAINAQTHPVQSTVPTLDADLSGDWLWVVPDDTVPEPDALARLLNRVQAQRDAAVVGCLLIEPRRRGAGKLVSDWAQTISGNGRTHTLTDPGELHQGQLLAIRALGVPTAGMLVRGDVWRFLGGFTTELPRNYWGLDFGWRANLVGYTVMADPDAQLTNYAGFSDPAEDRAAGLMLTVAHAARPWRWAVSLRLIVATLLVALGYLLGKDPERSAEEVGGLWRWLRNGRLRRDLNRELASLPRTLASVASTKALRPAPGSAIRRAAGLTATRFGGWLETFSGRAQVASFDEMTGGDFAETAQARHPVPLAAGTAAGLVVAGLAASRNTFGEGLLTASQLLPAPDTWPDLVSGYVQPVAGSGGSGTPWAAVVGIFSLVTLGRPDWLVTLVLVLAVPLAWLLAFRLLRQLIAEHYVAASAALAYALAPALIGGLNVGSLGLAALALLLPTLGYTARQWLRADGWSWRGAGAVAFWLLLVVALVPLFWAVALAAAIVIGVRAGRVRVWGQVGLAVVAPLLGFAGPWGAAVMRYPGRLLTGIEPLLAPGEDIPPWLLVLGRPVPEAAPLWLAAACFGLWWLAAVVGAIRSPRRALPAFATASAAAVIAVVITRLPVQVPPGAWTRPQAMEWVLLMAGALLLAAVRGLQGITEELSDKALGLRHFATLALAVVTAVTLLVAAGWWVFAGQTGQLRRPVAAVPAFVHEAQLSDTPGRTLALSADGDTVSWGLAEADFSRLGDAERGLAFGGDADARASAASVATRLVGESSDDLILDDLVRLGVSYVTLAGGEPAQRISINNTPGLGLGTGTDAQFVWPVPDSAIAVVIDGSQRSVTGNGLVIPDGGSERVLHLAVSADPHWVVEVGGRVLAPTAGNSPGIDYALGAQAGVLNYRLVTADPWWAWIQLAGLLVLAVVAAPSVRRRVPTQPRRVSGGEQ